MEDVHPASISIDIVRPSLVRDRKRILPPARLSADDSVTAAKFRALQALETSWPRLPSNWRIWW